MTNLSALAANIFVMHVADRCDLPSDAGTPVDRIRNIANHAYEAAKIFAEVQDGYEAEAKQAAFLQMQADAQRAEEMRKAAEVEAAAAVEPSGEYAAYTEEGYPEGVSPKERAAMEHWTPDHAEPDSIASYRPAVAEAATDEGQNYQRRDTIPAPSYGSDDATVGLDQPNLRERPEDHAGWNPEENGHG
jgi:hypothetical protein